MISKTFPNFDLIIMEQFILTSLLTQFLTGKSALNLPRPDCFARKNTSVIN